MTSLNRVSVAVSVCIVIALSPAPIRAADPPPVVVRPLFQMLGRSVAAMAADEEVEAVRNYPDVDRIAVSALTMMGSYSILHELVDAPPADRDLENIRQAATDLAVEALRVAYAASLQIGARRTSKK